MKEVTAARAAEVIECGHKVFIHSIAMAPLSLIEALAARAPELRDVEIYQIHTEGPAPYAEPGTEKSFRVNNFFVGANMRKAVQEGRADYIPCFLSEVPGFFRKGIIPLDVALIQVSPPDRNGYVSLGTSVDVTLAAVQSARTVIAEVNPRVPRTAGDGNLHVSQIDFFAKADRPLPTSVPKAPDAVQEKIGEYVAGLTDDGATLQMGIGAIPNAALAAMTNHKDLGVHTEMFSDGLIDLVERGVITNAHKAIHPRHIVTGFAYGTERLYDFVDQNPSVRFLDMAYVNNTNVIRKNPKVTAINSAIEIDLTGQACADSIGTKIYSGVGGQMDFMRGAAKSEGGKAILALASTTRTGKSKITARLAHGAGVVSTRAHLHYVVTEHGVACLYGKSLRDRARALIAVAAPEHRAALAEEAFVHYRISV